MSESRLEEEDDVGEDVHNFSEKKRQVLMSIPSFQINSRGFQFMNGEQSNPKRYLHAFLAHLRSAGILNSGDPNFIADTIESEVRQISV